MSNKASKDYWNEKYESWGPKLSPKNDIVRLWLEEHFQPLNKSEKKTCLEVGCYPGQYLSVFGDLGYELYGVDYCSKVSELTQSLKNYSLGKFWEEDFFQFSPGRTFDVVSSFGFIEHFDNFAEVIEKHIALVNKEGYLVLVVPNFIGAFQHWFHYRFDKDNFDRHYIPAMEIDKWVDILERANFKVLHKGYFGRYCFWIDQQRRSVLEDLLLRISARFITPMLSRVLPRDKRMYSPFGGIIARR